MNTRTHEIILEYVNTLMHKALNRELKWESSVGAMEYSYLIKSLDGEDLLGVAYDVRSADRVDITIHGETFRTRNKPIIDRVGRLFRIINYERTENVLKDDTIKFMRSYVQKNR